MSDVTVIGLGAMGSAIARRFIAEGFSVSVWNRSHDKADAMAAEGATPVADLETAIRASDRIVICVIDYDACMSLCARPGIAGAVSGRTVIQLTGGTPSGAAETGDWMGANTATYLDGAIMGYPGDLGQKMQVLVAGPQAAFHDCRALLGCLAGDLRHVGENIRAAKTLDMALLARFVGLKFCAMHGAHICESEGVDLLQLAELLPVGDNARAMIETVASDDFDLRPGSASVDVASGFWLAAQAQARARGINSDLPDLFMGWCQSGIDRGWGRLDNACLIKVLRGQDAG